MIRFHNIPPELRVISSVFFIFLHIVSIWKHHLTCLGLCAPQVLMWNEIYIIKKQKASIKFLSPNSSSFSLFTLSKTRHALTKGQQASSRISDISEITEVCIPSWGLVYLFTSFICFLHLFYFTSFIHVHIINISKCLCFFITRISYTFGGYLQFACKSQFGPPFQF